MFGGQQQQNTPFGGGGGFGQQQQNTAPAFGSPAPAPAGLFGSPPASGGLFGGGQPAPAPAFGQQPAAPFGGGGGAFGSAPAAPAPFGSAPSGGLFGQTQAAPAPAFGGGGGFGAPAQAPGGLFGQPAPAPGGLFGQPAPAPGSLFGQPAPAPGGFGAPAPAAFGQQSTPATGMFGQAPAPAFGAPAPAFGAPAPSAGFGAPAAGGLFGSAPAPTPGVFGAPAPAFGAPAPAPGGLFGSNPAPAAPGGFGAPSTFGAPAPSPGGLFGAPAPAQGGFGAPASSPFGAPAAGQQQQQPTQEGTRGIPFQVQARKDNNGTINLQSITSMPQYENKSFEELRFEDYSQGNKGSATTPTAANAGGFGFGGAPAAPATGGMFGSAPAAPAPFGAPAPAGGLFGSNPAPAPGFGSTFGSPAPAQAGGLFGAAPSPAAPAPFGAPAPAGGLFGSAPAPLGGGMFGSAPAAPAQGGLFGSAPAGGMFGSNPAPAPFGAPASGGLFGSSPAPAPFGAPASGGLFGQPAPAAPGGYGFGAPSATSPGGGLFGAPPPAQAPFGAPPLGGGLFGSNPAQAPYGAPQPPGGYYGQQQAAPPPSVMIPSNTIIIPPTADEANVQGIRALLKTKEEMEKSEIWKGEDGKSKASTPTSVSEAEALDMRTYSDSSKFFPDSTVTRKIRPRGFPKTENPFKSAPLLSSMGRGGANSSTLMPPDSNFRSPVMQLVVHPGSLSKPRIRDRPSPQVKESPVSFHTPRETVSPPPPEESISVETAVPFEECISPTAEKEPSPPKQSTALVPLEEQSPGLAAYYQKTINSPIEPSPPAFSAMKKSAAAPTLTKESYETTPPIEELATYSDADLAAVPNFSVFRPGYGKVEWLGAVDIRNADLDRIVVIEAKDVSVYNEDEKEGSKPAEGTRLNRPADISYYEVFPKNNPDASAQEKQKFVDRLEKSTRMMAAEFLGYNKITGEWNIRVQHFSRYAFNDDDSEDEENTSPEPQSTPTAATKNELKSILHRKSTPFNPSKGKISFDLEMTPEQSAITAAKIRESVKLSSERTFAEVFDTDSRVKSPEELPMEVEESDDEESVDEGLAYVCSPPSKPTVEKSRSKFSIVSALLDKRNPMRSSVDVGFRMSGSFRVAFAPDGSLLMPLGKSKVAGIKIMRPTHGPEPESDDEIFGFLEAHLDSCEAENHDGEDCPVFALPSSLFKNGTKESHASFLKTLDEFSSLPGLYNEGKSTFTLLACLLGYLDLSFRSNEGSPGFYPPRAALLEWLVGECEEVVSKEIVTENSNIGAVFAALSGGDVGQACTLAADAGLHDLSAIIATVAASGAAKSDLAKIVIKSGVLPPLSAQLDRLIKNIAGLTKCEDDRHRSGYKDLDWRRRLVLRALTSSDEGIEQIIRGYRMDVTAGSVPHPRPHYSITNDFESVQFKVLCLMSGTGTLGLAKVVEPSGYTAFHNDVALSFHLASALVGAIPLSGAEEDFEKICSSYASQLIAEDKWAWAVFVILCVTPGASSRTRSRRIQFAKEIVLRYFGKDVGDADNSRKFLQGEIGIPSSWFSEAMSNRSLTVVEYVSNTLVFDPEAALRVLETRYLPNVFFMSKGQVENVMGMIEGMASARNSVASGVFRFFRLTESLAKLKLRSDSDVPSSLERLIEEHDALCKLFKSRLSTSTNPSGYCRFYVEYPMRVSLLSMLREALSHLGDIRLQIGALMHDAQAVPRSY